MSLSPGDLLREFLAERDVPCPRCGHNLRASNGRICPECGGAVAGMVILSRPRVLERPTRAGAWTASFICVSAAALTHLILAAAALLVSILITTTGFGPTSGIEWPIAIVHGAFGFGLSIATIVVWKGLLVRKGGRLLRWLSGAAYVALALLSFAAAFIILLERGIGG